MSHLTFVLFTLFHCYLLFTFMLILFRVNSTSRTMTARIQLQLERVDGWVKSTGKCNVIIVMHYTTKHGVTVANNTSVNKTIVYN